MFIVIIIDSIDTEMASVSQFNSSGRLSGGKTKSVNNSHFSSPWPFYACDWSMNSEDFCTVAVGSFLSKKNNFIQVRSLASPGSEFKIVAEALPVEFVTTKVLWSPSKVKNSEYLASSGNGVNIWKVSPDGTDSSHFTLTGRLVSKQTARKSSTEDLKVAVDDSEKNPPAPVTSFDWNRLDPTLLVTASYDTTCTLWCLETGAIKTQLIAHDKEVFDVAFSPTSADSFVSVGADGSLRLFDVRQLDHSTIVYESGGGGGTRPLLRVQWNTVDPNYLSTFAFDSNKVIIMDIRMPSVPAAELSEHPSPIVAMRWSPRSSSHLLTADESTVHLWDLADYDKSPHPIWSLDAPSVLSSSHNTSNCCPIQNILWPAVVNDCIGLATSDSFSILPL